MTAAMKMHVLAKQERAWLGGFQGMREGSRKCLSLELFVVLLSLFLRRAPLPQAEQTPTATAEQRGKILRGSYELTCSAVDTSGNDLRAICRTLFGDWLQTKLHNPRACAGDISNLNGTLTCQNQPRPPDTHLDAFGEAAPGVGQRLPPWAPLQEPQTAQTVV